MFKVKKKLNVLEFMKVIKREREGEMQKSVRCVKCKIERYNRKKERKKKRKKEKKRKKAIDGKRG